jgi:hypothetical protein
MDAAQRGGLQGNDVSRIDSGEITLFEAKADIPKIV